MRFNLFVYFVCLWCFLGYAQCDSLEVRAVFQKSKDLYSSKKSYKVSSIYKAYMDSVAPIKTFKGVMVKRGDYLYSKMDNTESIQEGDKQLVLSHSEAMAKYQEGVALHGMSGAINIAKLLPLFDRYSVTSTTNGYDCEFIAPDISSLPFDEVVIKFRKDYSIVSQEMITKTPQFLTKDKKSNIKEKTTRLVLSFSELKDLDVNESHPKLRDYIIKKQGQLALKGAYSKYQIINL